MRKVPIRTDAVFFGGGGGVCVRESAPQERIKRLFVCHCMSCTSKRNQQWSSSLLNRSRECLAKNCRFISLLSLFDLLMTVCSFVVEAFTSCVALSFFISIVSRKAGGSLVHPLSRAVAATRVSLSSGRVVGAPPSGLVSSRAGPSSGVARAHSAALTGSTSPSSSVSSATATATISLRINMCMDLNFTNV